MTEEKGYFTPEELAKRWKISAKTLADWRRIKRGPTYFQPGGKNGDVRYPFKEVEAYEQQFTISHTGGAR